MIVMRKGQKMLEKTRLKLVESPWRTKLLKKFGWKVMYLNDYDLQKNDKEIVKMIKEFKDGD